jgi:Holliday junction resolvase-like predicted endonuclease
MGTVISAKKHEKVTRSLLSNIRGMSFEQEVATRLRKKYAIEILEFRHKTLRHEIDIVAREKGRWGGRGHLVLIECKARKKISLKEFLRFKKALDRYRAQDSKAEGIFAYRGELDRDVKPYIKDTRVPIMLERFK